MPDSLQPDSLQGLLDAVEAADSAVRLTEAIQRLADSGLPEAIPALIAALSYNNPGAAVAAVTGLIRLGQPAVPALLNELDQHNYTARAWAIRSLAGIGDPRGLTTLLGAATADFAMSVRRAAARGLGTLHWAEFSDEAEREIAQAEVLDALLFVCEDEEWIVRYAAVTGLEALAVAIWQIHPDWRLPLLAKLNVMATQDPVLAVQARVGLAQQRIQADLDEAVLATPALAAVPAVMADWRLTLEGLYSRKSQGRPLAEGDPRRFRALAAALTPTQQPQP